MDKHVVILAGGKGTRLWPYTASLPKPLVPIGDTPILELIMRQLVRHGFRVATLAVNHQADIIRAYFGDGAKLGLSIRYSLETQPLSTIGPLRLIESLPENFLIMNGDILTDLDFGAFLDRHCADRRLFTVAAARREQMIDYGVIQIDERGRAARFMEKPRTPYLVSMGVYAANRDIVDRIPPGRAYGFDALMVDLIATGRPADIQVHDGYWLDIGRPDDYQTAIEELPRVRQRMGL
ncbi:MAG: nucleotidyltransferase family protein [Alphaproteobacteria bacterium]|nr:nucleotidyltransferase family protein [Alphaproteobacteria bacterium]